MSGPFEGLRRRLDIIPAHHRTRPVLTGSVMLVVVAFALLAGVTHNIPLITINGGREVRAVFAAANQVSKRTVVRVGGVEVGRVAKVQPGPDPARSSLVTMRITNDDVHLHSDASAQIRWRTLLGGLMYIDLHPGSPSAPPLGDRPIPVGRTSNQVELDQFLQPYDGTTAEAQRKLLTGLRAALADPRGVGRTLDTLSPTLRTITQGVEPVLGREPDDLRHLVAGTAKTVSGLADARALQELVVGGNRALAAVAAQRRALGQLLELAPGALDSTFTTMQRLRTTLGHLDPLVTRLRPGVRELAPAARAATPAFVQTEAVLREARPLLRAAGPALDALRGTSTNGVPVMQGLNPTLQRLTDKLLPFLRDRDGGTRLRNYEAIGPFFSDLDAAAAEFDKEGYRIRLHVPPTNSSSAVMKSISADMAAACAHRAPAAPAVGCTKIVDFLARSWFGSPREVKR